MKSDDIKKTESELTCPVSLRALNTRWLLGERESR